MQTPPQHVQTQRLGKGIPGLWVCFFVGHRRRGYVSISEIVQLRIVLYRSLTMTAHCSFRNCGCVVKPWMLRLAFATVFSQLRAIAPDSCSIPSPKVRSPNPLRIHRVRSQIPVRGAFASRRSKHGCKPRFADNIEAQGVGRLYWLHIPTAVGARCPNLGYCTLYKPIRSSSHTVISFQHLDAAEDIA